MSKPNGSKPIQRLAKALRPNEERVTRLAEALRPTEEETAELAAALQDCLDSAAQTAAQEVKDELIPRLDNQDKTLRLFWNQFGGDENKRLPIDD